MNAPPSARFADLARGAGKAERTRARLMDAAAALFARDGFEGASVHEITRLADVANGTFYTYFRDREAIAQAVAIGMAGQVAARLDQAMAGETHAARRVVLGTCGFIDFGAANPDWGRTLFRAAWQRRELRAGVMAFCRADLELGAAQGHFTTAIDDTAVDLFAATTMGGLFRRLEGAGPETGRRTAELQLVMLGVPPTEARDFAWDDAAPIRS
ncbi:TetR/AcrR family transcriptional regulator [Sphingomonas sp.]|uniref:TetR/AcrR family transcriptional regulator n=1 Tax=Sphingomonas sp. TaxID=28214 RepID=UPI001B2C8E1B|nr:TetR/AcrR family transcriptional regulator [Sphingomonas sp.]MBO9711520.1 TetR/AcrR family transcriptional regulator [Sphingomonas sp.]